MLEAALTLEAWMLGGPSDREGRRKAYRYDGML